MKQRLPGFNKPHLGMHHSQNGVDGRSQWGRVRGRPRLGWMDSVKVALGNGGMTVEAARKGGEPWCICS